MAAQKSPVQFEIQISVNLSDFQQIQVKFHQLFATVMRRSLENLKKKITKNIVRLTRERRKGRKKLFWAEIAKNLQKVPRENRKKVLQPKILKFYRGR